MTALHLAPQPAQPGLASEPRGRRGWLLAILLSAVAIVLGSVGWQYRQPEPFEGVDLAVARHGAIDDTVTALGKLQPRDYVDVGAQVSGQLQRLTVEVGDRVEAGALLAEIDPRLQQAKLDIDRAQLAQLVAERRVQALQLELAHGELARQEQMEKEGATRQDVLARAQSEVLIAGAKLSAIDAQIRQVESTRQADSAQLGFTRIFAPISGTVVSIEARVGQTLIASQQAPVLLRISDLASMTVWTQVSEADVPRMRVGMPLYFTTLGHGLRKWHGTLRKVLPAQPKLGNGAGAVSGAALPNSAVFYSVLFDVDNASGELLPEMSAQVFFVVAAVSDALLVPVRALSDPEGDGTSSTAALRVAKADGSLERRVVKLGIRNHFEAQILEGLSAGERVVEKEPESETAGP